MTGLPLERITVGNIRLGGQSHVMEVPLAETASGDRHEYFLNIIRRLIRRHGITNRRWFISYDGKHDVRGLDQDCVVFIYGEERSLTPWRYEKAGLILKAYGMRPQVVEPFRADLPWAVERTRVARNKLQDLDISWRMGRSRHEALTAKTLPIPLGYARQKKLPVKPLNERRDLIWFAGSPHDSRPPGFSVYPRLSNLPKLRARQQLVAALLKLRESRPEWPISLQINPGIKPGSSGAGRNDAKRLMDSKVCVVPRGTTPETHRFFEAMRAGCVVISQDLPDFWFYRSAPALRLKRWSELEEAVDRLLAEPGRMEELHAASRRWWDEVAGPAVMAETIAAILNGSTTVAEVAARR